MTKNQFTNLKTLIIETISIEKPQTTEQLIILLQQRYSIPSEQTIKVIIELENENKLRLTRPQTLLQNSPKAYTNSHSMVWFWVIIIIAIATIVSVFTIPENAYPIAYVRNLLGLIFVLFLPGYSFIKALFPYKVPIKTLSNELDQIERIALSLGMSLALTPIVGLILYYTPWGTGLIPITFSLLALTLVCAVAAMLRECKARTHVVR